MEVINFKEKEMIPLTHQQLNYDKSKYCHEDEDKDN